PPQLDDLHQQEQEHRPYTPPSLTDFRTWKPVEHLHGGLSGEDGMLAEFQLNGDLHQAAHDDNPEGDETRASAQRGGSDEFTRPHNRRRKNEPRTQKPQSLPQRRGWRFDRSFGNLVIIARQAG